jgi:hypothetical protein
MASAWACVIVPLVTSADRTEAIAASAPPDFAIELAIPVEEVRVTLVETTLDFGVACAIPMLPTVRATVVTAIAITFFFDVIYMTTFHSALHFVETLVIDYS